MSTLEVLPEIEAKEQFHIDTNEKADWYLKQLACYDAEMSLVKAQMEAQLTRLKSDKEGLVNLYGGELEQYIKTQVESDKRGRKSIILPHGTCQFRSVPAALKLTDESAAYRAVQEWGKESELFTIQLNAHLYREQAKQRLEETGELLPGVEMSEARESFSIKFGKE